MDGALVRWIQVMRQERWDHEERRLNVTVDGGRWTVGDARGSWRAAEGEERGREMWRGRSFLGALGNHAFGVAGRKSGESCIEIESVMKPGCFII